MFYVYSTPSGAGRIMGRERVREPWPGLFLVGVFDDDQEEEAAELLHWLARPGRSYALNRNQNHPHA